MVGSIYVYKPVGQSSVNTTLTLDYSNGYFNVPDGITFAGAGSDTLSIAGGSFAGVTDNATGVGTGSILLQPASGRRPRSTTRVWRRSWSRPARLT